MKTDKYLPAEDKRDNEAGFAKQLNAAKHKNPPSVFRALGLHTALLAEEITVTYHGGTYIAGTQSQEFCTPLGHTRAEVEAKLKSLSL